MNYSLDFAYAYGKPTSRAVFRAQLTDFIVTENLGFTPSGEGEHIFIHIIKRDENTQWVADKLAKLFKVKSMDVGFCGMKDRFAETTQWFSVYAPKVSEMPDFAAFIAAEQLNIEILEVSRHQQKLRRGTHASNDFEILLRDLPLSDDLEQRLARVGETGVPNYFGEQRFGREANNLQLVEEWVESGRLPRNRNKRSIVMSSARSYLFNKLVDQRIQQNCWAQALPGDVVNEGVATAALWGRGKNLAEGEALALEQAALAPFAMWCERLEHCGLNQERRPVRLVAENFSWTTDENTLTLKFRLPPGAYATSILREIAELDNQSRQ